MNQEEMDERLEKIARIYDKVGEASKAKDTRNRIGKPLSRYFKIEASEKIAALCKRQFEINQNRKFEPYQVEPISENEFWENFQFDRKRKFIQEDFSKKELEPFHKMLTLYNQLNQLQGNFGYSDNDLRISKGVMRNQPVMMAQITGALHRYFARLTAIKKGYKNSSRKQVTETLNRMDEILRNAKIFIKAAKEKLQEKQNMEVSNKQKTKADSIRINNKLTIKEGNYLQRGDELRVFYIRKIADKSNNNSEADLYADYKVYNLETLVEYEVGNRNEFLVKEKFQNARVISESDFKVLRKAAKEPVSEKEQEAMLQQIRMHIRKDELFAARSELVDYFRKVVLRQPEKLRMYFEMRAAIPTIKYRPCICVEDYDIEVLKNFFAKLKQNVWDLIPDKLKAKPRKLVNRSRFKADPEDKHLQQLVKPYVSTDNLRKSMLGVYFDESGIAVTNAHLLLYLPNAKSTQKGIYCMTRKCFKENDGNSIIDAIYPKYHEVLPKAKTKYKSYELDINRMRGIVQTLKNNGFQNDKSLAINFLYGNQEFISFNALKMLIPAMETFGQLGHSKVKLWINTNTSAAVLTATDITRKELNEHAINTVLVMPLFRGDTWEEYQENLLPGNLMYDLEKESLWFYGSDAKAISFGNKDEKAIKVKLAKAKAAAQKQRIRILEMIKNKQAA